MSEEWNKNDQAAPQDAPLTPTDGGAESVQETPYAEPSRPKINGSTLALVATFAGALVILYLLGLQNKPRAATAEQKQHLDDINRTIDTMLATKPSTGTAPATDGDQLLHIIGTAQQNPNSDVILPNNAFGMTPGSPTTPTAAPTLTSTDTGDPELIQVPFEVSQLKVQSIMMGTPPMAMINNSLVKTGMQIGHLTVAEIQPGAVILAYKQSTWKVELNTAAKPKP